MREEELLKKAITGNVKAFEILMDKYMNLLFNYILGFINDPDDSKDILQNTVLSIWQSLKTFKGNSSFKTWIIGISRNKINDFYRLKYRQDQFEGAPIDERLNSHPSKENMDKIELSIDVENALSHLCEEDREILFLVFQGGLNYKEVSKVIGIPVGTIKSRIHYIKKKLRPMLDNGGV